jgi:hypothetical protein
MSLILWQGSGRASKAASNHASMKGYCSQICKQLCFQSIFKVSQLLLAAALDAKLRAGLLCVAQSNWRVTKPLGVSCAIHDATKPLLHSHACVSEI